jgi:hypothetical protein
MRFKLFEQVALARDIPGKDLRAGDVATIVEHHPSSTGEDGYTLEIFDAVGDTLAVITLAETEIEPLRAGEILSVRSPVSA